MGIAMCNRCDRMIDLDWHGDDVIVVDGEEVCTNCATDAEWTAYEEGG